MKILFCLLFFLPAISQTVLDADTFIWRGETIRIAKIDALERGQHPIEHKITKYVETLLKTSKIILVRHNTDRYGRTIATVYVNGQDLGYLLISKGYVFVYDRYNDNISYKEAETIARNKKLGIHKYNIIKPWLYSRQKY